MRITESLEITSANPTHTNTVIQANELDTPDLEEEILQIFTEEHSKKLKNIETNIAKNTDELNKKTDIVTKKVEELDGKVSTLNRKTEEIGKKTESITKDSEKKFDVSPVLNVKDTEKINAVSKKVELFEKGTIGELSRLTSTQLSVLKDFVSNPTQFMIQTVFRKFAKGLGVIAFALIIYEAVQWIISELLKPGRLLDIRFKRDIKDEIISFRKREEQQKLRQGFSNIIITASPRLRGGQGQTVNTFDLVRGNIFPSQIGESPILLEASGMSLSKAKGRRSFGGPGS